MDTSPLANNRTNSTASNGHASRSDLDQSDPNHRDAHQGDLNQSDPDQGVSAAKNDPDNAAPIRRRMSKSNRRVQLLDAAASLLVEHGAASMSMERLASTAGVSKALPYKHFDNSEAVLVALYRRETEQLGLNVWNALKAATPDDELIRVGVSTYFDEIVARGRLLAALSQPGSTVAATADPNQAGVIFEVEILTRFHGVDRRRAKAVAGLIQGAVVGAAGSLRQGHASRAELEDDVVTTILALIRN